MSTIFHVFNMDYSLYTYFFLLTIQEFKIGDRSGMSTIFYAFKIDYSLYVWILYFLNN